MSFHRLEPGSTLNSGEPTIPRPAATVILVRGGSTRLEVLLVQRSPTARVMAGAWVFPGGSVDPADGEGEQALRRTALRELREETGIALAEDQELLPLLRWITPPQITSRFDAWFYVAAAPGDARPVVDQREIVDHRWISPSDALTARSAGELFLVFPTIRQLQQLAEFDSADALLEHARRSEVRPVQPRVIGSGDALRILLPGEPGYDD